MSHQTIPDCSRGDAGASVYTGRVIPIIPVIPRIIVISNKRIKAGKIRFFAVLYGFSELGWFGVVGMTRPVTTRLSVVTPRALFAMTGMTYTPTVSPQLKVCL